MNFADLFGDYPDEVAGAPIPPSPDLARILDIPQRDGATLAPQLVGPVSDLLRRPGGTMTLRPLQALGLVEAHDHEGLMALLPVGEGKTLLSFLLPVIMKAERPFLLVPAALVAKTMTEFRELAEHWQPHPNFRIDSYQMLSRNEHTLTAYAPDLIIADEVHKLKDPRAACTKRVYRYLRAAAKEGRKVKFCGMSGTIANRTFRDWWHLQQWALPPRLQPLPFDYKTLEAWDDALAEKRRTRRPVGALSAFGGHDAATVRTAFGKRLRHTPGIITAEASEVAASLEIELLRFKVPEIDAPLKEMRATWATPDGREFCEAVDMWRHARELANGFYYRWKYPPPDDWADARREFNAYVRGVLGHSRTLDTAMQVAQAHAGAEEVVTWQAIRDSFTPETEPVWLSDTVIEYAAEWAKRTGGLVWCEHIAVGARIESRYGLPYFGELGTNSMGTTINEHRGPAAVSALAVSTGFNLQRYTDNLVLNATPTGKQWEQMIGRTHRYGQDADAVRVQVLTVVDEQVAGFEQAQADAEYIQQTTGQKQKLCLATYTNTQ